MYWSLKEVGLRSNKVSEQNLDTIISNYTNFLTEYSCKPNSEKFPVMKDGAVIDENKSVKWNREEVARLQQARAEEVKRLNRDKNELDTAYEHLLIGYLAYDYDLKIEEMQLIYKHCYMEHHDSGIHTVISYVDDFVTTYEKLIKVHNKRK